MNYLRTKELITRKEGLRIIDLSNYDESKEKIISLMDDVGLVYSAMSSILIDLGNDPDQYRVERIFYKENRFNKSKIVLMYTPQLNSEYAKYMSKGINTMLKDKLSKENVYVGIITDIKGVEEVCGVEDITSEVKEVFEARNI